MLRGMQVKPRYQSLGIGKQLLAAIAKEIGNRECYCIPYAHPEAFYGKVGFRKITENDAPQFLQLRVSNYRKEFKPQQFTIMRLH